MCSAILVLILKGLRKSGKAGYMGSKDQLLPGDLVFFDTDGGHNYINHSGIYIGDGSLFMHHREAARRVLL